ncbi:MAG: tetratricopeptide repeat protein, partial [Nitrospirota bacterium]|nr:tetratricopeptide repeat protein [Nitrospirota bacterium]
VFLPTTIFPLNTILQENRGYLSAVSFGVFGGVLFGKVLRQYLGIRSLALFFSLIIIIYSVGTISRNRVWKDGLSLWSDAMAKGSNSLMAYTHLSKEYILRKEYTRGEEVLNKSVKLYPGDFYSHYNLSYVYYKTNRYEEALKEAHTALKIFPSTDVAHVMPGLIYYAMGDLKMAAESYKKAVELNPNNIEAHFNLGVIHETTGQLDQAIGHYREVINHAAWNRELAEAAAKRLRQVEGQSE